MYAVIQTGGKQYRVSVGDKLKVESLEAEAGSTIELDNVLMVADGEDVQVGSPLLETKVTAKVTGHGRGEKILVYKMKRRKNYRRTQGHRQNFTEVEVLSIGDKSGSNQT